MHQLGIRAPRCRTGSGVVRDHDPVGVDGMDVAAQLRHRLPGRPACRYHLASPTAGIGVGGEYRLIEPPSRIEFTWQWDGETEVTTVAVLLDAHPDGTELTFIHSGFADTTTRDDHVQGWSDCLDRLTAHLTTPDQTTTEGQKT